MCQGVAATIVGTPGNDVIMGTPGRDVIVGLGGNDMINGGGGDDLICAVGQPASSASGVRSATGTGDATLIGGPGNDTLIGGPGNDTLIGGPGNDVMMGGAGSDTVSYADHTTSVTASLDNTTNNGSVGEADTIGADVENLTGGSGDDLLIGNSGPNRLDGGPGNDTLMAGAGTDALIGGPGADHLDAGPVNATDTKSCSVDATDVITAGCLTTPPVVTGTQASHVFLTMPVLAAFASSAAVLGNWTLVVRPYDALTNAPLDGVGWAAGGTCAACQSPADGISASISFLQPTHDYYLRASLTDQNGQSANSADVPFSTPAPAPLATPPAPTLTTVGTTSVVFAVSPIPDFNSVEANLADWHLAVRIYDAATNSQAFGEGWESGAICGACQSPVNGVSDTSGALAADHPYFIHAELTDQYGQIVTSADVPFTTLM